MPFRDYSPRPVRRQGPPPTMSRPEVSAISTTSLALSTSSTISKKSCKTIQQFFFDLPPTLRSQLSAMAANLAQHLDLLIASGQLRATNVLPIGKEILDLTSLCCIVNSQVLPYTTHPSQLDMDSHVRSALHAQEHGKCCACCSVMDLMDLEGEVLHSFPDDGDDGHVSVEVQMAALNIIEREVTKALEGVESLLRDGPAPRKLTRKQSLETMVRGLSRGLKVLWGKGKGRRESAS